MRDSVAKQLLEKVKKDYKTIAQEFSNTRKWLWPEFKFFKKYLKDGQTIVDVGCGNGRFYEFLRDLKNVKYIGTDNNERFLEIAQKNYSSAKFVYGDLLHLPSNLSADIMFSIASFHHVASSRLRKKSVQELHKNISENGLLVLTVWNLFQKRYRKHLFRALINYFIQLGKYDWNDTFIPWGKTGVNRYYHAFTPRELKNLFSKNGFEIVEMFYTRKGEKTSFLKAHNICLVCRKK